VTMVSMIARNNKPKEQTKKQYQDLRFLFSSLPFSPFCAN
jgi:hypothetical protein